MDRRTFLRAGTGTAVGLALAGCVGSASRSDDYDVGMSARRFDPAAVEVTPGTTVVWLNTSSVAHTVTAYEDRLPDGVAFFASGGYETQAAAEAAWVDSTGGAIHQGDTFEYEFTDPGEYPYYCIPHEAAGMTGVVSVSEEAGESPTPTG